MSGIGFLTGFVMFGAMLFLPLYQQSVQGASATNSGLLLLPMLLSMMAVSLIAGRVTTNSGKYKIFPIIGGALVVVGLFLLSTMDTTTTRLMSGVYMAVLGAGMGFLMQITMLVAQNSVEMKDMGVASSSTTLFRTLGSSFGVSIMGAIFTNRVGDEMEHRLGAAASSGAGNLASAQLDKASLAKLAPPVREAYQYAVSSGTHGTFLVGSIIAVAHVRDGAVRQGGAAAWFRPGGTGRQGRAGRLGERELTAPLVPRPRGGARDAAVPPGTPCPGGTVVSTGRGPTPGAVSVPGGSVDRMTPEELANLAHLRRARDLIDREYARPLDVPTMARHALMSPAHFSRRFRAAYGETPYSYLMTRRIERAMALLRGGMSVTDACMAVGCTSLGSFSSRFTEIVGETPSAYRAREHDAVAAMPACVAKVRTRPARAPSEQDSRSGRRRRRLALTA